ncbi:MAG: hypothetical protein KDA73_02985 [Rhodobacteraceae bacterium]|nr:hypothetical protein [Paracoccaceae bacterium]
MRDSRLILLALLVCVAVPVRGDDLTPVQTLGKTLFYDGSLSLNGDQPCVTCHSPTTGYSGPDGVVNGSGAVYEGSVPGRFGNRRPPTAAYAAQAPVFHHTFEDGEVLFVGGAFLDGRATGHLVGNAAADQAEGPFLNPLEMALPHAACVVQRVCNPESPDLYPVKLTDIWGGDICAISFPEGLAAQCADANAEITIEDEDTADRISVAFTAIAQSLAAYEMSPEMARYSSKYDQYLDGEAVLTAQEDLGRELFEGKALCSQCHVTGRGPNGEPPLLTDYTYDNLGVPRNPDLPYYAMAAVNPDGTDYIDRGLGDFLRKDPIYDVLAGGQDGKFKVPTLRNVSAGATPEAPRSYMHNGYFKTLEGVVKFYNLRDVWPRCASDLVPEADALAQHCWPGPEVAANVNGDELGDLKLTEDEELALVAFMKTFTDQ